MEKLTLRQHPAGIRESTGRNEEYPVDWNIFEGILRDFSQLKINGELSGIDSDDFKEDLLRNNSDVVINFIEKSINETPQLHPFIYLLLFEVAKNLYLREKITKEKYSFLFEKLLKEHGDDISKRYDIEKIKNILTGTA
jgi:hypothetical protein